MIIPSSLSATRLGAGVFFAALIGCVPEDGNATGEAKRATVAAVATSASAATSSQRKAVPMSASKACGDDAVERSACMIELILADLRASYGARGGGGISRIEAISSTGYAVSLPQEERVDQLTYEFAVANGKVTMKSKSEATQTP